MRRLREVAGVCDSGGRRLSPDGRDAEDRPQGRSRVPGRVARRIWPSDAAARPARGDGQPASCPGTPASPRRSAKGDIITRLNDQPIYDRDTLMRELGKQPVGAEVRLTRRTRGDGRTAGREFQTTAQLSKKYVAASRPAFAQVAGPALARPAVDYATALPPELLAPGILEDLPRGLPGGRRGGPRLARLESRPAPRHVADATSDDRRVTTPAEFYAAVGQDRRPKSGSNWSAGRPSRPCIA